MDKKTLYDMNIRRWNRKLINSYWTVVVGTFLIELLNSVKTTTPILNFISYYVVLPTLILIAIVALTDLVDRRAQRYGDIFAIISASLIAATLTVVHQTVQLVECSLLLPIVISILYYQRNRVIFASIMSITSYLCVLLTTPYIRSNTDYVTFVTMCGMMILTSLIAIAIVRRGEELGNFLNKAAESNHELILRSTMIEIASKTDALTETFNHKSFHEHLDEVMIQGERNRIRLQLALFDIDFFKSVNDTFGHRVGDIVLRRVAQNIRDRVTPDDFVARYGGEEFAVIFVDKDIETTHSIIENIRKAISDVHHPELDGRKVTISVGLNEYRQSQSKTQLFEGADRALYMAKRSGRNQTVVADV